MGANKTSGNFIGSFPSWTLLSFCFKNSPRAKLFKLKRVWFAYIQTCRWKICMGYWPVRGQDGWILAQFFFACLWTETESRSINSQKKERGQYPTILTEQTWSIKDLLYGFTRPLFARSGHMVSVTQGRKLPSEISKTKELALVQSDFSLLSHCVTCILA